MTWDHFAIGSEVLEANLGLFKESKNQKEKVSYSLARFRYGSDAVPIVLTHSMHFTTPSCGMIARLEVP